MFKSPAQRRAVMAYLREKGFLGKLAQRLRADNPLVEKHAQNLLRRAGLGRQNVRDFEEMLSRGVDPRQAMENVRLGGVMPRFDRVRAEKFYRMIDPGMEPPKSRYVSYLHARRVGPVWGDRTKGAEKIKEDIRRHGVAVLPADTLSSWSESNSVARRFSDQAYAEAIAMHPSTRAALENRGVVIKAKMPIERSLVSWRTARTGGREREHIIMGDRFYLTAEDIVE